MNRARGYSSGKPGAAEQDRQERQAYRVSLASTQQPCGRPEATDAPSRRGQLGEVVTDVVGQRYELASTLAVRQRDIAPQVLKDADELRLPAAVESADPDSRLQLLIRFLRKLSRICSKPRAVLAIADEAT